MNVVSLSLSKYLIVLDIPPPWMTCDGKMLP